MDEEHENLKEGKAVEASNHRQRVSRTIYYAFAITVWVMAIVALYYVLEVMVPKLTILTPSLEKENTKNEGSDRTVVKSNENLAELASNQMENGFSKTMEFQIQNDQNVQDSENKQNYFRSNLQFENLFDQFKLKMNAFEKAGIKNQLDLVNYLYLNPDDPLALELQRIWYEHQYQISKYEELPFCITIVGYNTLESYKLMLESIFKQNYQNYKIVYVDDGSSMEVEKKLKEYVREHKNHKMKVWFKHKHEYALKNRVDSISLCDKDDIVIDVDSHDFLVGRQVLKLVNALYHRKPQTWVLCLNNFKSKNKRARIDQMTLGEIPHSVFESNSYRHSNLWVTTELRTFRKQLFMKIDPNDFVDKNNKFYEAKSDAFTMFPLIELAGERHFAKENIFVYYYYNFRGKMRKDQDKMKLFRKKSRMALKVITPYQPLKSLDEEPKRMRNYQIPAAVKEKFLQLKEKYPDFTEPKSVTM